MLVRRFGPLQRDLDAFVPLFANRKWRFMNRFSMPLDEHHAEIVDDALFMEEVVFSASSLIVEKDPYTTMDVARNLKSLPDHLRVKFGLGEYRWVGRKGDGRSRTASR